MFYAVIAMIPGIAETAGVHENADHVANADDCEFI